MDTVTCAYCKWSVESWKYSGVEKGLVVCTNKKSRKYCLIMHPDDTCPYGKITMLGMLYKIIKTEKED